MWPALIYKKLPVTSCQRSFDVLIFDTFYFGLFFSPFASPFKHLSSLFLSVCVGAGGASGRVLESTRESQPTRQNVLCDGFHVCIIFKKTGLN